MKTRWIGRIVKKFLSRLNMSPAKNGQHRKDILPGLTVDVVLKKDQRTGKRTRGIVKELLTSSSFHPHGIKVRLEDGQVGRVQEIVE
jgi:uncharacterized repeat protein (TIGR03833 family)